MRKPMDEEGSVVSEQPSTEEHATGNGFAVHPKVFVFFDKATSALRFEVKADADGKMPIDQVVSLLAMNCMVRGQSPKDYVVMVGTGENLLSVVARRATKLMEASMSLNVTVQLSRRQQEVLRGVMENLSNKEIAARLNFSERTAKFHVSALLGKFNVESRVLLMTRAADLLAAGKLCTAEPVAQLKSREGQGRSRVGALQRAVSGGERRAVHAILEEE